MLNENGDKVDKKRDILAEIADFVRERVGIMQEKFPLEEVKAKAESLPKGNFPFENALKEKQMSFICEVKKASPSKGLISPDFRYMQIANDYEQGGATAISCLTETHYFQGQDKYLADIADFVDIPVLRKDFFVDEYMIYEAKNLGASAVLLICAILTDDELKRFFEVANNLGLSSIFEAHDEEEVSRALKCGARIIGVNNRNLKTFELDINTSVMLRKLVPNDVIFISESGIKTRDDIKLLEENNVNAVLIGETLMRADDIKAELQKLKGFPKIKICGLTKVEDIEVANELNIDYIGFVFAKSKRQVTKEQAKILKEKSNKKAVGVFVNEDINFIFELINEKIIDMVQLHGDENEKYIRILKKFSPQTKIIKAISVNEKEDILDWKETSADYLLLDNGKGGTGEKFDWTVLEELEISKPFFIAGGLNSQNVKSVLKFMPYAVDVSGGVETDGTKDGNKMKEFTQEVRK